MAKVIITIEDIHNGLVAISFTGDIPAIEEQKILSPAQQTGVLMRNIVEAVQMMAPQQKQIN